MGGVGWDGCVNDWVGALSTIPKEHLRVIIFFLFLNLVYVYIDCAFVRCTIMKDWVGALSTIPREYLRVNNLVFVYMYFVYMYFVYMYLYISSARRPLYDYAGLGRGFVHHTQCKL